MKSAVTQPTQEAGYQSVSKEDGGVGLPNLVSPGPSHILAGRAQERALGVLAKPLVLKLVGAAVPLLAVINERCGDGDRCRFKYGDVAKELGVSVTTVKAWSESLATLGYFTREACGPTGVEIRLCPERWPSRARSSALVAAVEQATMVLEAVRMTVDRALASAVADLRREGVAV